MVRIVNGDIMFLSGHRRLFPIIIILKSTVNSVIAVSSIVISDGRAYWYTVFILMFAACTLVQPQSNLK